VTLSLEGKFHHWLKLNLVI